MKNLLHTFFHFWRSEPITLGGMKRGVRGVRICTHCGMRQITKPYYGWWIFGKWATTMPHPEGVK